MDNFCNIKRYRNIAYTNKYFLFIKLIFLFLVTQTPHYLLASPTLRNKDFFISCKKEDLSFIEYPDNKNENFFFLDAKEELHLMQFKNWNSRKRIINYFYKTNSLKKKEYPCILLGKIGYRYRDRQRELSMRPEHQRFNEYRIENNFLVEYICKKEEDEINLCERYLIAKSVD